MLTTRLVALGGLLGFTALPKHGGAQIPCRSLPGFQLVQAQDQTLTVCIPRNWMAGGPFENFQALSPLGETFGSGTVAVFPNQQSAMRVAQLLQGVLPPEQLATMIRLASPPLLPGQVIGSLIPQLAPTAILRMRVLQVVPLFTTPQAAAAFVHYQYILLPQQDALLAALVNPALRSLTAVPMEGAGFVVTFPQLLPPQLLSLSPELGYANTWSFFWERVEAPQQVFGINAPAYERIFSTYQADAGRIAAKFGEQQQVIEEMREVTRQSYNAYHQVLGNETEVGGNTAADPGPRRTVFDLQCWGSKRYLCNDAFGFYCFQKPGCVEHR
jgi:hypothetical protein